MSNHKRKFYIVKDEENQDGGFIPIKVISFAPVPIIYGAPIVKFGSPYISSGTVVKVNFRSKQFNFTLYVPYKLVRYVLNNVYKYRVADDDVDSRGFVYVTIATPAFTHRIKTDYPGLGKIVKSMKESLENGLTFVDDYGKYMTSGDIVSEIERVLDRILDDTDKKDGSTTSSKKYGAINL